MGIFDSEGCGIALFKCQLYEIVLWEIHSQIINQELKVRTSLAVQCLRLHTSTAGEQVLSLVGKIKITYAAWCGQNNSKKRVESKSPFLFFILFYYYYFFLICSEFCHKLKWNGLEITCLSHPDPPSHLPLHPLPPGLPRAPGPSAWNPLFSHNFLMFQTARF